MSEAVPRSTSPAAALIEEVAQVLQGKEEVARLVVTAMLARGHVLLEDVPGVGKTTLARTLATVSGLEFRRVQFTSDLMPADVVGGNVFDRAQSRFEFRPGPVFSQVLLADEINRTTPKTQSALLEAMGEGQVSVDGKTHDLPKPFFVVATQNPEDFHGTFPLPESQLDRFLFRLRIGYPSEEVERAILARRRRGVVQPSVLSDGAQILALQKAVDEVEVAEPILDYLHRLILATRSHDLVAVGVSIRGALAFDAAIRAYAFTAGRTYALPDDVQALAIAALSHRLRLCGRGGRQEAEGIVGELLQQVPVSL